VPLGVMLISVIDCFDNLFIGLFVLDFFILMLECW